MKEMANSGGYIKTKIATWAKSVGAEGITDEIQGKNPSFQYKIAKKLVFNKVRQALGLDKVKIFAFGAAPLATDIRFYFLTLGFPLRNVYGMSECAGPATMTELNLLYPDKDYMKEAGTEYAGTELKIVPSNPGDEEGKTYYYVGEICYRGRHIFMGYFKNPEETAKSIDADGFLHSGDIGRIDANGVLFITGRVKELLITAAGENIPPVLI
jgi:long-chain-fatty-acid--CoA ligase ACSBG